MEIGLSCRWAQPLQKNGHVVQKQYGGTLKGNDISFLNDVISVFFLPHYIVCVPATWFVPCDHILQRAQNIIITTLQKYVENYKTISL